MTDRATDSESTQANACGHGDLAGWQWTCEINPFAVGSTRRVLPEASSFRPYGPQSGSNSLSSLAATIDVSSADRERR
jgi:hypothetical protein